MNCPAGIFVVVGAGRTLTRRQQTDMLLDAVCDQVRRHGIQAFDSMFPGSDGRALPSSDADGCMLPRSAAGPTLQGAADTDPTPCVIVNTAHREREPHRREVAARAAASPHKTVPSPFTLSPRSTALSDLGLPASSLLTTCSPRESARSPTSATTAEHADPSVGVESSSQATSEAAPPSPSCVPNDSDDAMRSPLIRSPSPCSPRKDTPPACLPNDVGAAPTKSPVRSPAARRPPRLISVDVSGGRRRLRRERPPKPVQLGGVAAAAAVAALRPAEVVQCAPLRALVAGLRRRPPPPEAPPQPRPRRRSHQLAAAAASKPARTTVVTLRSLDVIRDSALRELKEIWALCDWTTAMACEAHLMTLLRRRDDIRRLGEYCSEDLWEPGHTLATLPIDCRLLVLSFVGPFQEETETVDREVMKLTAGLRACVASEMVRRERRIYED
eukprot:TRINITY_DN10523_c0_g1_i1.p1 TRINITY_DN10523_c0_g1~~TRINITY_DN10523_c0_g1_i1.p1  ORF type:complete len:443 (+),score=120.81 TRINITY_DN10523_c0_g1_i1:60-1388(+)